MRALDILKLRLRSLLYRDRLDNELSDELAYHLERQVERNLAAGMPPAQARREAHRAMGGVTNIQEQCRDTRALGYLYDLAQDLRYAARATRRSPVITVVAIVSLALGIGANTAVFSLINAVMLRSLPVAHPEQLVRVARFHENGERGNYSWPLFLQLQEGTAGAADLFASNRFGMTSVMPPGAPAIEQAVKEMVTGDYFRVLGVRPVLGRAITADDNRMPNGNPVTVISYGWWKRRFGLDPSILGKTLMVSGAPLTVVGIAPPEFFGVEVGGATDLWVPLATMPQKKWLSQRGFNFLAVLGRLKPGVSVARAGAQARVVQAQIIADNLSAIRNPRRRQEILAERIAVEPAAQGFSHLREQFSEPLRVLLAIVAGVLLVACSNIANLQLARASAREREISVRLAIGAGRFRLVRQLMAESLLLSLAGGVCGVAFAYWGCQALLSFLPKADVPLVVDLHPDARVLGFTLALSLLSGILFGLVPALRSTRTGLDSALKSEARSVGYNPASRWLGRSLIAGQVALSLLLLTGSGLFIRSLRNLESADLGFDREHVLTFGINVASGSNAPEMRDLRNRVIEQAGKIPGVRSAGDSFAGTYGDGGWTAGLDVPGYTPGPDEPTAFDAALVGPGYFETMGISLVSGRAFTERDDERAPSVVVINQSMARHFFGTTNALGRHIGFKAENRKIDAEIVGVVRDARHHGVRKGSAPMFYANSLQTPGPWPAFQLRATGDPRALVGTLTRVLQAMQPGLTVQDPTSLDDEVNASLARERLVATISGFFAAIALLLACIGVYGTLSYSVTRRTSEVGIRMTLGARREQVLWMVIREALLLVSGGIVIGALAARAATKWVGSLLFGLAPGDLTTVAISGAALLLVAILAGSLPARRAASLDPTRALRYE